MRVKQVRQRGWMLVAVVLSVLGSPVLGGLVVSVAVRAVGTTLSFDYISGFLSESLGVMLAGYVIGRVLPWSPESFAWVGATAYVLKRSLDSTGYESYRLAKELSALARPGLPEFDTGNVFPWWFLAIGINLFLVVMACRSGARARASAASKWWKPSSVAGVLTTIVMLLLAAGSLYVSVRAISPEIQIQIRGLAIYGPGASRFKDLEGQVLEVGLDVEARNSGHAAATLSDFSFSSFITAGTAGSVTSSEYSLTDRRTGAATDEKTVSVGPGELQDFHITFTIRQPIDGETIYQVLRRVRLNQRAMLLPGVSTQPNPLFGPELQAVDASGRKHVSLFAFLSDHYEPVPEEHVVSEFWFNRANGHPDPIVSRWDVVRPLPASHDGTSHER